MLKYIFGLCILFYFNNAFAEHKKVICNSIDNGVVDKIFDLSMQYEKDRKLRLKSFSICKAKESSKYFVVLDDTPLSALTVFQVSGHELIQGPRNIFHFSELYDSWIISLEQSEFKKIEKKINKLEMELKKDGYEVLDGHEICLSYKNIKDRCYVDPEDHTKERGLQTLIEIRDLLNSKFPKVD